MSLNCKPEKNLKIVFNRPINFRVLLNNVVFFSNGKINVYVFLELNELSQDEFLLSCDAISVTKFSISIQTVMIQAIPFCVSVILPVF